MQLPLFKSSATLLLSLLVTHFITGFLKQKMLRAFSKKKKYFFREKLISRGKIQIVVKLACFFAGIKPPNTYDIVQKSTTYSSKIFTVSHRCCITRLRPLHTPFGCARSMRHLGARATRALSARSQIFWLACIAAKRALAPAVPSFWARSRSLVLRVWSARACWP